MIYGRNNAGGVFLSKQFSLLLKGIACIVIALHHYSQHVVSTGISDSLLYKILSTQGGFSGVALFFFLSGYGLMESERQAHKSIMKGIPNRLWALYYPVLIINLIQYVVIKIASNIACCDVNSSIIDIFRFYVLDNVFWFVGIIMVCYISFYVCCLFVRKPIRNISMIGGMIATMSIPMILNEPFNHIMSIPFFFIGVWVSEYKHEIACCLRNIFVLIALAILIFITAYLIYRLNNGMLFHIYVNVVQTIALLCITSWFTIVVNFNSFLGEISYPVYLVHNKILKVSLFYDYWPSAIVFLISTLILALLYSKIIKYKIRLSWDKFKISKNK